MPKTSVKSFVRQARADEARQLATIHKAIRNGGGSTPTVDSFVNMAYKLGIGADNPTSHAGYGFNPITRNRTQLEWMHRGSWVCGLAVDIPADDMTRKGVEFISEMDPKHSERMTMAVKGLNLWGVINEVIRWGRLYGGCLGVVLVDGQDMRTPFNPATVGPGQFKGLIALDRWMVEPSLQDLVTDMGPFLGQPRYYTVQANAPALRGVSIHYTRVAFRHLGIPLPYQQALTENLWGVSVLERMFDRLIGFDTATAGVIQLVHKAYLRTLKVHELRQVVSSGGVAMEGLVKYVDNMRRFEGLEGIALIDAEDEMMRETHQAFSGLDSVLIVLGQQLSGALQIPLVRLFGQSPSGLNSTGESDLRTYYDFIAQQQEKNLLRGTLMCYYLLAKSLSLPIPDDFNIEFSSLWELTDEEKSNIASTVATAVTTAHDNGLLTDQAAMKELRQSGRTTGIFTNITRENIEQADDTVMPPVPDAGGMIPTDENGLPLAPTAQQPQPGALDAEEDDAGAAGEAGAVQPVPRRRVRVQQ